MLIEALVALTMALFMENLAIGSINLRESCKNNIDQIDEDAWINKLIILF